MDKLKFSDLKEGDVVSFVFERINTRIAFEGQEDSMWVDRVSFTLVSRVKLKIKKYFLVVSYPTSAGHGYTTSTSRYASLDIYNEQQINSVKNFRAISLIMESEIEVDE